MTTLRWPYLAVALAVCACRSPLSGPWPPIESSVQEYRVGAGDVVRVAVFGNAELSSRVTVRPDGRVSLPLIDEVVMSGHTVTELNRDLTERYRCFVQNPQISVIVEEVHSYRIYVVGKVAHPGDFEARVPVTVLQALALSGGTIRGADADRIVILRRGSNGQEERYLFSYTEALNGRTEMNFNLRSGDTVIIP